MTILIPSRILGLQIVLDLKIAHFFLAARFTPPAPFPHPPNPPLPSTCLKHVEYRTYRRFTKPHTRLLLKPFRIDRFRSQFARMVGSWTCGSFRLIFPPLCLRLLLESTNIDKLTIQGPRILSELTQYFDHFPPSLIHLPVHPEHQLRRFPPKKHIPRSSVGSPLAHSADSAQNGGHVSRQSTSFT